MPADAAQFLSVKRVEALYLFSPGSDEERKLAASGVAVEQASSYFPSALGLNKTG